MTQTLIPTNLPLYIQCLQVPSDWKQVPKPKDTFGGLRRISKGWPFDFDEDLLEVHDIGGPITAFDPWEKRAEFLRLQRGDRYALLEFLRTIGLFERASSDHKESVIDDATFRGPDGLIHSNRYLAVMSEDMIWGMQRKLRNSLLNLQKETGEYYEFGVRIIRKEGLAQYILTTTTFMDAMLLTLSLDRVLKAKVRKCARPDCGVLFSVTGGHKKKYCQWYCGHIESVRKGRKRNGSAVRNAKKKNAKKFT